MQGILVSDDAQGHLIFTRAGKNRATGSLVEGKNILAASAESDWSGRYSDVEVKAQKPNLDDKDDWSPDDEAGDGGDGTPELRAGRRAVYSDDTGVSPSGSAKDAAITRHRPLIIYAENVSDAKEAKERAEYEVRRRIGQSLRARITVQGWTQPDGSLWDTNMSVPITSELLGLNMSLVIGSLTFVKDDGGTRTELELTLVDAFMATEKEADQAAKPASADSKDNKAEFWK